LLFLDAGNGAAPTDDNLEVIIIKLAVIYVIFNFFLGQHV